MLGNQASKSKRRRDTMPLAARRLITVNSSRLINGNFNISQLNPHLRSQLAFLRIAFSFTLLDAAWKSGVQVDA